MIPVRPIQNSGLQRHEIPFLIPGIGSQGGDLESVINVLNQDNIDISPYIINSSRSILYASDKSQFETAVRIEADKFVNLVKPMIFNY